MAVAALDSGLMMLNQKAMQFHKRVIDFEGRFLSGKQGDDAASRSTVGADCAEAFSLMYALELSCRVQMDVLASGQPYSLPPDDLCEHTAQQLNDFPVPPRDILDCWLCF